MTWKERLLKKDASTFKKYVESTTAHGVVRIFKGKSIIRRLFWLIIVLTAAGGCLYNISDRIRFLISEPTSTTISVTRKNTLTFPAVTVCNLNSLRFGVLEERNLTNLIQSAIFLVTEVDAQSCEVEESQSDNLSRIIYEELVIQARHKVEELIEECFFAGKPCGNLTEVFEPVFTNLGICYTFNSAKIQPLLQSRGTGQRQGLQLLVNVNQLEYATPTDAGVKVAIHTQSEPPLPDDQGIGVPTGRNAFISIKEQSIVDKTGRSCNSPDDLSNLNFLQGEYDTYSESACLVDCIHSSIADNCECISARSFYSPDTARYSQLPNCTLEEVCCLVNELISPSECNCPAACSSVSYETTVSYSYFPAEYISQSFATIFGIPVDVFPTNFLEVSVYFESLNIETQTTSSAYSFVALLSDIGGQLGLFLGVSVISIMEFGTWVVDEIKNRVFGISEEKMKNNLCCSKCQQKLQIESNDSVVIAPDNLETSYKKELENIT